MNHQRWKHLSKEFAVAHLMPTTRIRVRTRSAVSGTGSFEYESCAAGPQQELSATLLSGAHLNRKAAICDGFQWAVRLYV